MKCHFVIVFLVVSVLLAACGGQGTQAGKEESRQAKHLLQGIWSDEDTESVVFKMQGDSVYYPDSTSMTAYFKVVDDTLYIGSAAYHIEKQAEHLLWFKSQSGEIVKLVKKSAEDEEEVFEHNQAQILTLTEVQKRDTVVMYEGNRYHLYVTVNPTRYKVVRHTLNEDGLDVENVYYDNVIHLSVFQGSRPLFSRDLRKKQYGSLLKPDRISQSILNNATYDRVDQQGFHFNVSLCEPGEASCYLIEHIVSFDGQLSTKLQEY